MTDLLAGLMPATQHGLGDGAVLLRGFAQEQAPDLIAALGPILAAAPFRRMVTPGGHVMSVAMTNCGDAGWITDRRGYRYDRFDPLSGHPWPPIPKLYSALAQHAARAAGYHGFTPDACLINRYEPGSRLSLHQDRNERDLDAPIVSVSLGLPATFLFGGLQRGDRPRRIRLENGDVAVWGGPTRLAFHGIDTLAEGDHPLTSRARVNLTFRTAL
jgi:DNA oxidative demethylase